MKLGERISRKFEPASLKASTYAKATADETPRQGVLKLGMLSSQSLLIPNAPEEEAIGGG